jgi:D-glycero-D-manno-heptose 1,7-bisphosphate phosphatase
MRPAVFLDRDGILNEVVYRDGIVGSPRSLSEFVIPPEAIALCDALRSAGFLLVVVTNQPDVDREMLRMEDLEEMHVELGRVLRPDSIQVCGSCDDADPRRKPNPGMLLDAAARLDIDLGRSWIIGDGVKDISAGRAAGVRTMLLRTAYNQSAHEMADFDIYNLEEAADIVINDR